MRIVLAPDSFGSVADASAVVECLSDGWLSIARGDELVSCALSDGGPGLFATLAFQFPGSPDAGLHAAGPTGAPCWIDLIQIGATMYVESAQACGLVTFALDELDWEDEIRVFLEERASFSPDALTGLEANLRFAGPETMETKIFGRLTAWQNWIFQRPNAVGESGALGRYGTGRKPQFDTKRV